MLNNFNRRLPNDEENFLSMLVGMVSKESEPTINVLPKDKAITTSDLCDQIRYALLDVFNAGITVEENYVIKLDFSNNQVFKLRIIKE